MLVFLVVAAWFALKIPAVQNWVGQKIAKRLSKQLNTKVSIDHVSFSLFNRLELTGVYIEDSKKDTLLYAGKAAVRITDWFFWKNHPELKYVELSEALVCMERSDSVWNYQFLADALGGGGNKKSSGSNGGMELNLRHLVLNRVWFRKQDEWLGQNTTAYVKKAELLADEVNFNKKIITAGSFILDGPEYYIRNYPRRKPYNTGPAAEPEEEMPGTANKGLQWNSAGWQVHIKQLVLKNGRFGNDKPTGRPPLDYFDGRHILFTGIEASFSNLQWTGDTIRSGFSLAAKERSGLEVKSLNAQLKLFPNTLEFNNMLLTTPHSSIGNYLSFSFKNFDNDIADFIHKIRMNGRFENTAVSTKDLAFFAPKMAAWNRDFILNGTVRGTVDNLSGAGLKVSAGTSSLTGNLVLTGLPDINETFIDLNNALVQTNYNDLMVFAPALAKIKNMRLRELGTIKYQGNFTGFTNDFVTYGTLSTGLGNMVTDLNLKLPQGAEPLYSGKINTTGFNLGRLLGNNQVGYIGFTGKVSGTGFNLNKLKSDIDGTVTKLQYKQYTYTGITIKGRLEQKTFDGTIDAADPNLQGRITGLVKLGGAKPVFDITAGLSRANFKPLQLTAEDYSLTGNLKLNFTGSRPDDMEGNATLTGGLLTKEGKTIPVDNLGITAHTINGQRELVVKSNEFDGKVAGRFNYAGLGSTFQLLLNRYYPNLFDAPPKFTGDQDFSFELHTKQVDELVSLFNPKLRGFNGSNIEGRINTAAQTASFTAQIPEFGMNQYTITGLKITGSGNLEKLDIKGNAGQLQVGDSLIFYDTEIGMVTTGGQSEFTLGSSSNNTLNELNLGGTLVSHPDGISILFQPGSFTVNNHEWKMEKNGELILKKDMVSANDIRFSHGDQEIVLRSEPDSVNNDYHLIADIKNLNVGDFTPLFIRSNKFQGRLNGTVQVRDPLGRPVFTTQSRIDHFWLDNDSVGTVNLTGNFNMRRGELNYSALSNNKNYNFSSEGIIRLKDTLTGGLSFYTKTALNGTKVSAAKRFLSTVFSEINGNAVGELEIAGTAGRPYFTGYADITDSLEMTVGFTNVKYVANKARINFDPGAINFSGISIHDTAGRKAFVKKGLISHDGFFKDMSFNIEIAADTLLLLNTNRFINKTFYGYAVGDARLRLRGAASNMQMDIAVANPIAAKIELVTGSQGRTLGKADFIEFRTLGREMEIAKPSTASNLTVNINVNANVKDTIRVILDELAGDNIEAMGTGTIGFVYKTGGDITLNGTYTVEKGKYDFSLQSWLRKPFNIKQGSTIKWDGDPYNADIDIDAEYITRKKVDLTEFRKDLFALDNSGSPNAILAVSAKLFGKLAKPEFKFSIGYPRDTKDPVNPLVENILKLLENDPNEINRQVAFLVMLDKLLPYEASRNSGTVAGITGFNTISGFLAAEASKYFNNLLEKIFGNGKLKADIDFNVYTPGIGGNISSADASLVNSRIVSNFNFSRSWFDDRLTVYFSSNIDFGLAANQAGRLNFTLLPNVQVEYKLRPNGQVVATVFHRQVLDIAQADAERKRLSTGGGIIWRKEGETLGELFGRRRRDKVPDSLKGKPFAPGQ